MDKGQMMRNLPTDIILNIQSFLLGEPHLYKIKYNRWLKFIQDKYKISYREPYVYHNLYINQTQMSYLTIRQNIQPHMINNSKNLNRIISFINHYQYGITDEYDDETEEINLDDDAYDEVDIDDENPIKILIELTITGKEQSLFRGDIMWYNQCHTKRYLLENPSKKSVSKALMLFSDEGKRFKHKKERSVRNNEILQLNLIYFEIQVFIKRDDESDGEREDSEED